MDHWFIRAIPWIVRAINFVVWACGGWVVLAAPWRGEPLSVVAFFGLGGFAFAIMATYYVIRLGDYVLERAMTAQLGHSFAQALEDRLSVRVTSMTTGQAAQLWRDIDPALGRA